MKTITYDPAVYKLVPIKLSDDMRLSIEGVNNSMEIAEYEAMHKCMLAAVPDQLPGVREHSGEPCAFVNGDALLSMHCGNPAPVALSAQRSGWTKTALFRHPAPSQPSAEALVQAALEAAALWIDDCEEAGETISFSTVSASIRALSAQQIIESCKEKS